MKNKDKKTEQKPDDAPKDPNEIFWINEDEEYSKYLAQFFKGKDEVE